MFPVAPEGLFAAIAGDRGDAPTGVAPPPAVYKELEEQDKSRKRPRDYDSDFADPTHPADNNPLPDGGLSNDDLPPSKRRGKSNDILFRIVVPSRQIGRVIGKAGSQIQRIREETRATIKIADAVARHEERVIIISSKDEDSGISDAETALYRIAGVILEDNGEGLTSKLGVGHVSSNTIKLLIAGSQAGCLIGISGQNIENIRNSTGATVTILSQNQIPLCASAHESDRLVQVSGDVSEVLKALEKIGSKLRENPPKQVISIRPTYNATPAPNPSYVSLPSAEHVTSEMMISESLVGGLIGKNGSNISLIRRQSGATIKVAGGKGEKDHRLIHFGGTSDQVAAATNLVERYIYSQML